MAGEFLPASSLAESQSPSFRNLRGGDSLSLVLAAWPSTLDGPTAPTAAPGIPLRSSGTILGFPLATTLRL